MSVQVKTPTKAQFEHTEFPCGEHCFSAPEPVRAKDDFAIRTDTNKFVQPWTRKRRYSQSYRRDSYEGIARRKRLKSADKPLPTRFLLGGSIEDPLNLNGLENSEIGRILNQKTPQSSPLPIPLHNQIEVRVPTNITDPLNLNDGKEDTDISKLCRKKKHRHNRHKKKDDSANKPHVGGQRDSDKKKDLMEALKIDIEPEMIPPQITNAAPPPGVNKHRQSCDRIVSPVIRQISPKNKKRRRTNSGSKPDASSSISKALLIFPSPSSHTKSDKKTPPRKFYNRQFSKASKQQQQTGSQKNKKQPKFIYGNYNRYYGYRNPLTDTDHRLPCFKREWFEGKSVLDIGCNVGHLTLTIARDFHPTKIAGIDIDHKLIAAARKNIRYYMSSNATKSGKFPISNILNYGPIEAPPVTRKDQPTFPQNVLFMQGNYVLESDALLELQREEYDVILALSVTKWIHFNWGDDGLKRFFKRIYRQLRPGGRLILEPQPWSSYKKKKKLSVGGRWEHAMGNLTIGVHPYRNPDWSPGLALTYDFGILFVTVGSGYTPDDEIFANFRSIRLRPDGFSDYLLSKDVGFSTSAVIDVPFNSSKGFRRPIQLFTKPDTMQNSPYPEFSYPSDLGTVDVLDKSVPTQSSSVVEVSGVQAAAMEVCEPPTRSPNSDLSSSLVVTAAMETCTPCDSPSTSEVCGRQTPAFGGPDTPSVASRNSDTSESSCSCSSCCSSPDRASDVSDETSVPSSRPIPVPNSARVLATNVRHVSVPGAGQEHEPGDDEEDGQAEVERRRRVITRRRSI